VEVEAWGTAESGGGSTSADIQWLVTDQLGTPRMVFDKTGSLANMKRHDYLPFGEELFAAPNQRTTTQGYSVTDGLRQQFTSKERDNETGLDFFGARYYASMQGRFTGVDALMASARPLRPQSWNRYTYCINNPLIYVDPSGLIWGQRSMGNGRLEAQWFDSEDDLKKAGQEWSVMTNFLLRNPHGEGFQSFDRFSNHYESVSTFAVAGGIFSGITGLREAGFTSRTFALARMLDAAPNAVDAVYRDSGVQKILHSPEFEFLSIYSGAAAIELSAMRGFSQAGSAAQEATTTVGRWMSTTELEQMTATGQVQESYSTVTSVTHPPNPSLWLNAKPGSIFAEFDIPRSSLNVSTNGIGKIWGPSSIFGKARGISEMPPATNIRVSGSN